MIRNKEDLLILEESMTIEMLRGRADDGLPY